MVMNMDMEEKMRGKRLMEDGGWGGGGGEVK